ncbi:TPA: kinase, partial [Streptococcus equi subsp. equi]|nr:kinase [Streptococcus equi subsp. equi]
MKEWNDVDGKVADCYKIGNLFLYLLGKLHIRDNNILTGELKNLLLQKGINSNIYKLIEYLLSENSDIEEAINMIRNDIYSYHFQCTYKLNTNIAISDDWNQELVNIISLQDTLITKYNKILDKSDEVLMQLKSEVNLGLNGLAGVLFYLSSISYDNEIIEKGIDFILESLVEDSDGNRGVLISENSVSPYLSNGTAGIVQLLIYVNSDKYIKDIKNL